VGEGVTAVSAPEVAAGVLGAGVAVVPPLLPAAADDEAAEGDDPAAGAPDADEPELVELHPAARAPATAKAAPVTDTLRAHVVMVIPVASSLSRSEQHRSSCVMNGNAITKTPLGMLRLGRFPRPG
jgi:hypothetical protein